MKVLLVGGAVRDQLLGRPVLEKDWLVLNSTPEAMIAQGFTPVGQAFPVFLHPKTHEEYALARTERKSGYGHKGFVFQYHPDVSLNEDLMRRDLTINAMAQDESGQIIDPYGGKADCRNKILRHVSDAFCEDPLRVLRVARFAATFPDFKVHPTTQALLQTMVSSGELATLSPERVWKELSRALLAPGPRRFFKVLSACGAQQVLFPSIDHHLTSFSIFDRFKTTHPLSIRFAALLSHQPPSALEQFARHYPTPKACLEAARLGQKLIHTPLSMPLCAENLSTFFDTIDAYRRPDRLQQINTLQDLCTPNHTTQWDMIMAAFDLACSIDTSTLDLSQLHGPAIGQALKALRTQKISAFLDQIDDSPLKH